MGTAVGNSLKSEDGKSSIPGAAQESAKASLTPDISDKSDKSRRGELLAGKERAFVSRLGSQGRAGGSERRVKGSSPGTPPVEPLRTSCVEIINRGSHGGLWLIPGSALRGKNRVCGPSLTWPDSWQIWQPTTKAGKVRVVPLRDRRTRLMQIVPFRSADPDSALAQQL